MAMNAESTFADLRMNERTDLDAAAFVSKESLSKHIFVALVLFGELLVL
jgi:hypothetical protein